MNNRKVIWMEILLAIVLVLSMLSVFGCASKQVPASTSAPPAAPASAPAAQAQTVKIGLVMDTGNSRGVDMKNQLELLGDLENAKGGIDIGGQKYKVEFIQYNSQNSQTVEAAAVNKLTYEDKVKFIMASGEYIDAWLKTTEDNKVIVGANTPSPSPMMSNIHYTYNASFGNSGIAVLAGWFCQNLPDKAKGMALMSPENQMGHMILEVILGNVFKGFGITPTNIFYPANSTDLSSLGTKIMSINPTSVASMGGGDVSDGLAVKAVWQAGYRGQFFSPVTSSAAVWAEVVPVEALEGFVAGASTSEFEPAATQMGQDFKTAWKAKYGTPLTAEISATGFYTALKTAMQQAGTATDTDKIISVIHGGLKFEAPSGAGMMISRPDMGNDQTVDAVATSFIKQIKAGKPTVLATVSMDDALGYFRKAYGTTPRPAPPK
jgi:branched-chain amino acid transport system substrate-binding protein